MANGNFRFKSIVRANALTNVTGTATRTALYLCNSASFEPIINEVSYEGDGTELIVYSATGFTCELTFDALPVGLMTAFGKTAVTASLEANETDRVYWMTSADATGVVCGLEVLCTVIDDTNNVDKYLGIVVPVGTLSTLTPPELATSDKAQVTLQFAGTKTAVDIAGDALPGVPTGGCFWYYSVRTALPT